MKRSTVRWPTKKALLNLVKDENFIKLGQWVNQAHDLLDKDDPIMMYHQEVYDSLTAREQSFCGVY